ncbi:hypothetical protein T07_13169 [Trichinella nelsoni]|uniref:Uncharacterized protein n=1 Tax=Trichinella nelsoni TaxID=6336 RepID=A0A0V0SLD8_9BILA|nr:hypothetical protein T07_13169 [Trichinella nelsoni]
MPKVLFCLSDIVLQSSNKLFKKEGKIYNKMTMSSFGKASTRLLKFQTSVTTEIFLISAWNISMV